MLVEIDNCTKASWKLFFCSSSHRSLLIRNKEAQQSCAISFISGESSSLCIPLLFVSNSRCFCCQLGSLTPPRGRLTPWAWWWKGEDCSLKPTAWGSLLWQFRFYEFFLRELLTAEKWWMVINMTGHLKRKDSPPHKHEAINLIKTQLT